MQYPINCKERSPGLKKYRIRTLFIGINLDQLPLWMPLDKLVIILFLQLERSGLARIVC